MKESQSAPVEESQNLRIGKTAIQTKLCIKRIPTTTSLTSSHQVLLEDLQKRASYHPEEQYVILLDNSKCQEAF